MRFCVSATTPSAWVKRGARSNGIAHGVGSERSIDKRTPPLPSGGVWWRYQWSNSSGATAQPRAEASMRTPIGPLSASPKLRSEAP
eukprot:7168767-Prymnesium_polylepis.1